MNDARFMGECETIRNLRGDIQSLGEREAALGHHLAKLDAGEHFHRHVGHPAFASRVVDGDDVGMVESARGLGFL